MAKYTNLGLVKHCEKALKMNTMYMWGGIFRAITDSYVAQLAKMYPTQYSAARQQKLKALPDGYFGVDCVGLIKSYCWSGNADGGTGSPEYAKNGCPDVNAHGMYAAAKVKGPISTIPETPGIIVYSKTNPHVGVYIGGGYVVESTLGSRGDGVVKTKLKDFKWEYWFQCPYIAYEKSTTEKQMVLAYSATARANPTPIAASLGNLSGGTKVTVIVGSDVSCTGPDGKLYTYVKIKRDGAEQWIVKSALRKI